MAAVGTKSKGMAALLAFLLGAFGVDDFYVGNKTAGIIRLVIFVVGVGLGAPLVIIIIGLFLLIPAALVSLTWSVVNLIKYLTMSDERFQELVAANLAR